MTRATVAVAALVLVGAGCGDDGGSGGGGGDPEAFCDQLQQLDEEGLDLNEDGAFEQLGELVDLAPGDVADDLSRIIRAGEQITALPTDDPDSLSTAFEILLDPAVVSALNDFGDYAQSQCDIEVPGAHIDPNNPFGDLSDLSGEPTDSTILSDDEPSNTDLLEAYLDDNYGDTDWVDLINSRGVGTVGDSQATVTLGLSEAVDDDTAVEVCVASLQWAEQQGFDSAQAEVQGPDQETLATGDQENGCNPA